MSRVIFRIPPERQEVQIGLGAISLLTAIAIAVSLVNRRPTPGYATVMDQPEYLSPTERIARCRRESSEMPLRPVVGHSSVR